MNQQIKTLEYYMGLPYTIVVKPSEEGGYFIKILELRGCMTQAETWEEIFPMIQEAKEGWLEVALEFGHTIPEPEIELAGS